MKNVIVLATVFALAFVALGQVVPPTQQVYFIPASALVAAPAPTAVPICPAIPGMTVTCAPAAPVAAPVPQPPAPPQTQPCCAVADQTTSASQCCPKPLDERLTAVTKEYKKVVDAGNGLREALGHTNEPVTPALGGSNLLFGVVLLALLGALAWALMRNRNQPPAPMPAPVPAPTPPPVPAPAPVPVPAPVPPGGRFCGTCGAGPIPVGTAYCAGCGTRL